MTLAIGRLVAAQDDEIGSANAAVAVLSWSCWSNRFRGDPEVIGRRATVDGIAAAVIGAACASPRPS